MNSSSSSNLTETSKTALCFVSRKRDLTHPSLTQLFSLLATHSSERIDHPICRTNRGVGGISFLVNQRWCSDADVLSTSCSPEPETLTVRCRPFYLPREFSSVVIIGVYIPPQANARTARTAIDNLAASITATESANPDSIVLALSDFNHTNLRKALPKYKQHVKCPTRDDKTLDHCYCTIPNALHAAPRAPLGRSDHAMVYLIPTYMQKLKSDKPLKKTVKKWTQEAILSLQGCFDCTDWAMFSESCANQDEYAHTVTSYASFCTDSCIPSKTVTIYANDKPWFSKDIKHKLIAKQ